MFIGIGYRFYKKITGKLFKKKKTESFNLDKVEKILKEILKKLDKE